MSAPRRRPRLVLLSLLLLALSPAPARAAEPTAPLLSTLTDVSISRQPEATVVHLKTDGAARYRAELMDSPWRLVLDFEATRYGWRAQPLAVEQEPLRQIRGSQYRRDVARLVLEFSRKADYTLREEPDGLSVIIPAAAGAPAPTARAPRAPASAAAAAAATSPARAPEAPPAATAPAPSSAPAAPASGAPIPPSAAATPSPEATAPAQEPRAAEPGAPAPEGTTPPRPASLPALQAQAAPPPAPGPAAPPAPAPAARPGGQHLISLEFKDADVVNLLRILAAESGRNIVIGEDVKGKMSISLRNVPWQLALDTILEARGLQKVEKDGVIRIVSTEQLTREREAQARVQEAKLKAEAEVRAKMAEAQAKEAQAEIAKRATEAAIREAEARGPLREETIRLSYADPEEVAKTLQGILGIPPEGQKITGPGIVGPTAGPIAEPPFSQLFGPAPPPPPPAVSVSQDVLAKGLTIRAHKPTNTLFLRLYAADLERVKKLIRESLDIPLPQVKIEARLEVLERNALEQLGIQWGGMTAQPLGRQTLVGQGLQTTTLGGQTVPFLPGRVTGSTNVHDPTPVAGLGTQPNPFVTLRSSADDIAKLGGLPISFQTGLPLGGNLVNLPISALPNAGPLPAFGINFGIIGTRFNVNLALQALAAQGKTRTLARPEIVTVENNKATMALGEEIPYATISSAGTQIQFKEALLKLEVTPTVITEGETTKIKLLVVVEDNSRGDVVNLGNAGAPPAINKRRAETQVLLQEGERLIIGGVTRSIIQNTVRKVPLLGDVPILGHLFKHREDFEQGRELVVFLTPTVLRGAGGGATALAAPPTGGASAR